MSRRRRPTRLAALLVAIVTLAGCDTGSPKPRPAESTVPGELAAAVSEPVEDSYYPDVGDPGVDALHYTLELSWRPDARRLRGTASIVFRATRNASDFQLDLGEPLTVSAVTLGGDAVDFTHEGKDLVVHAPVRRDTVYTAVIAYAGTPQPVAAPTTRSDFSTTGWTVGRRGQAWTMQEPYGAYTWYPVNDQPADKAFYDFTIKVPAPWVGIANGALVSRTRDAGDTVTTFHLDRPAASYLTTIAIGDYATRTARSASGVPITLWVPRDRRSLFRKVRYVGPALDWLESKLGPYPFATAGAVVVESLSAMETQGLITLGEQDYDLSREVILHELAHQWYGDEVTPTDWRDLWMNEGMATYLQLVYRAETSGANLDKIMAAVASQVSIPDAGPPGAYDRDMFGETNVYYRPARMWHALRHQVGDETFWRLVRDWPGTPTGGSADRDEWFTWLEQQTGTDLGAFFEEWLMAEDEPGPR